MSLVLRKAKVIDAVKIAGIVNEHAKKGIILPRPLSFIYDNIRDYMVIDNDGEVIGCGALHIVWEDLAEIRSLALKEEYIGKGNGRTIIDKLIEEAKNLGITKVFALTYRREIFEHLGFKEVDKSELPQKIWSDCVNCIHFPNCNETAVIMKL